MPYNKEHFIDAAGKFFGMQDKVIGYPEFDEKVIVKSNNEKQVKELFKDEQVRSTLASIDDFRFSLQRIDDADT